MVLSGEEGDDVTSLVSMRGDRDEKSFRVPVVTAINCVW